MTQPTPIGPALAPAASTAGTPSPVPQPVPASKPVPAAKAITPPKPVAPPVSRARLKRRHKVVMISFVFGVIGPLVVTAWYLWMVAVDQYASTVAFSVRKEEISSAVEFLGGITNLSGTTSSDTDILYEFLQSQGLVAQIDKEVGLRAMWSKPVFDPVYDYPAPGTIEDLTHHWARLVKIMYDSGTGLIELRVQAFAPEDATRIATAIYLASTDMINELSAVAREDAIRYSRDELTLSVERLKDVRAAVTQFRNRTQIIDPIIDLQSQANLLGTLQAQLAQAQIEVDLLRETTRAGDPRMEQAERRVRVTEDQIVEERRKLGIGDGTEQGQVYANLVGEYERLQVDREFAQQTYTSALATYDGALAEAQRKSRYLAAYVLPTTAEKSEYPQRLTLFGLIALFAFMIWGILVLVAFSLKDRR